MNLVSTTVAIFAICAPPAAAQPKDSPPDMKAVLGPDTVARLDLAYGKDGNQKLDLYRPKAGTGMPVVMFVHRGEWTKGDKSEVSYKPKFLAENGVVFVSVNYRLYPAARHPAHTDDVAAAVRWVHDHIAEHGGDPKKIVLMGHSAGCHLATLVALDPKYLAKVKLKPADLRGVIAWSGGAYDLVEKVAQGGSYKQHIINAFGPEEAVWKEASPVTHAKNGAAAPPFLFAAHEQGNPAHQAAERLAKLIRDAKGKAEVIVLENRNHQTAIHLIGAPGDTTGEVLLKFVNEGTK